MTRFPVAIFLGALLLASPALAQTPETCGQFAWPIAREQKLFAQPDIRRVRSGEELKFVSPLAASVDLKSVDEVQWSRMPERKPKAPATYGGVIEIEGLTPGLYQITLSDEAWLDVIQNDVFVKSAGHSGKRGCPNVRKSLRFQLGKGSLILQLSGAEKNEIKIAIVHVDH
jgi:hypothetical protein